MIAPHRREDEPGPGHLYGRWTVVRRLGQGGFGTVFEVVDPAGLRAALKLLPEPPGDEVRALARVHHPAVVTLLDAGGHGPWWLVMELATGRPLSSSLGVLCPDALAAIGGQVCSALAALHRVGLCHGDVKPDNLIWDPRTERVTLVDFGLAGGAGGGTPRYAAPEVLAGAAPSTDSDVYSLALTLGALATGEPPATEGSALLSRRQRPPELGAVEPAWLGEILEAWLAVEPADRPGADMVSDTFALHGVEAAPPTPQDLRHRAATVTVWPDETREALQAWLDGEHHLTVEGPTGAGRTTALRWLSRELAALGRDQVWLGPREPSWSTVQEALLDPALPGEPGPVDLRGPDRAAEAAEALAGRSRGRLHVLVDDLDHLDPEIRAVVRQLRRRPDVRIAATTSGEALATSRRSCLPPLGEPLVRAWLHAILGRDPDELVQVLLGESGGRPATLVDGLVGAASGGALTWRHSHWVVDVTGLRTLAHEGRLVTAVTDHLSLEARAVSAAVSAARRPIEPAEIVTLVDLTEAEVDRATSTLIALGWIDRDACGRLRGRAASALGACRVEYPAATALHRRLVERWSGPPTATLGWYLLRAEALGRLRRDGPACLQRGDLADRARLALAVWERLPAAELALPVVRALTQYDRVEEALSVAEQAEPDATKPRTRARLALQMALLRSRRDDWRGALDALGSAERVLGADAEEVLAARATVHFRAGMHGPALQAARALAEGAPPEGDEQALGRWLHHRALWAQSAHEVEGIEAALEVLEAVPPGLGLHLHEGTLFEGVRGRLLWHGGEMLGAARAFDRAGSNPSLLGAIEHARLCNNAALAYHHMGMGGRAIESWETALLGFRRSERWTEVAVIQVNLCQGLREAGRWDRALEAGRAAVALAREHGLEQVERVGLGNLGDALLAVGSAEEAGARWTEALELAREAGDVGLGAELARRLAEAAVLTRAPDALAVCGQAVEACEIAGDVGEGQRASMLLLLASLRAHLSVDVDGPIDRLTEMLRAEGDQSALAWCRRWAAECLVELGRGERAAHLARQALAWGREADQAHLVREVRQVLARAEALLRDRDVPASRELAHAFIELARCDGRDALLDATARIATTLFHVERAFVLLPDGEGDMAIRARSTRETAFEAPPSSSVLERAIARRREVLATDLEDRGDLRLAESVVAMDLRSALCQPLLDEDQLLGLLYLDSSYAVGRPLEDVADLSRLLADFVASLLVRDERVRVSTKAGGAG